MIKTYGKRALAGLLTACLMLGLLPGLEGLIPSAGAADTVDAFGISMRDWTNEEKKEAEAEAPFGVGASSTSLLTRSELYVSLGYDEDTWRSNTYDWNKNNSDITSVTGAVNGFTIDGMGSKSASYTTVETASMDLYGTGKDEYIANLAYSEDNENIQLFITAANSQSVVAGLTTTVASGDSLEQLEDLDTEELRGAIAVAAGDFDGDGKDTIVVYIPTVDNDATPFIREYAAGSNSLVEETMISSNVFSLLGVTGLNDLNDHDLENQPMVSLVAEDTDRDGFDELVITAGMNDVDGDNEGDGNTNANLGSQLFVYDRTSTGWNTSFQTALNVNGGRANAVGRIVWASSTVGNMIPLTSTSGATDYPEILAAGMIDGEDSDFWDINVDGDDKIGVVAVQIDQDNPIAKGNNFEIDGHTYNNVICKYETVFQKSIEPNGFTEGGFYESDDVCSLLAVQSFADKGMSAEESVFISGSVYSVNGSGVTETYTADEFEGKDSYAGSHILRNTLVQDVVAGNFDGNEYGKEQLIFVTNLRQLSKNNSYSEIYCYYNNSTTTDVWGSTHSSGYLVSHKGSFYITLNAVDTDDDSVVVKLKEVTRTYSEPDVLTILEAPPYFKEIGDGDTGNSQTVYGTSTITGSSSSNTFGFSAGVTVGYEADALIFGGGWEASVDNSFNWTTANTTETEWSINYANDTGENLVVVYRCPVVSYLYEIQSNGQTKTFTVSKTGTPATSMIPVDDYNEAAASYGLEEITDAVVPLGDAGNPASYRSSSTMLQGYVESDTASEGAQESPNGWIQYSSQGTTEQAITTTTTQEDTFEYGLDVSFSAWGKVFGAKAGVNAGFSYSYSDTSINGTSVTKSGSVTGQQEEGYDFQWKFVAWQAKVNENTIPVLGYLVQDVTAPPSPAQNLTADTITQDSITLSWEIGDRAAQQYRIYRVLEDGTYVLVGAADGDATTYTLTELRAGTTYTYVVRGVGYSEDGTAVESVNSSSVTARTTSADAADVSIDLSGVDTDGTLNSSGDTATITANVYHPNTSGFTSISYNWQLRRPGNSGWVSLVNGSGNEGIAGVTGASAATLTLTGIETDLDGSALRCRVAVAAQDGTLEYYYSAIAPLSLSGDETTTTIKVGAGILGAGSISDPYTGNSSYTTSEETSDPINVEVPVTVTSGEDDNATTYTIYSYTPAAPGEEQGTSNTVYVGVTYQGDTAQYYVAQANDGSYTIGDELTLGNITYYHYVVDEGTTEYTASLTGFDGSTTETAIAADDKTYMRVYAFKDGVPTTEYWYSDGEYYIRTEENGNYKYEPVAEGQAPSIDDIRTVYASGLENTIIVDEVAATTSDTDTGASTGSPLGDGYQIYTLNGGTYTLSDTIWAVSSDTTNLYLDEEKYASVSGLTAVTETEEELTTTTTTTQHPGTTLTLSASVLANNGSPVNTDVEFVITNITNGSKITRVATSGTDVTWSADTAGLYQITATAKETVSTLSSSAVCYYYANAVSTSENDEQEYRLLVEQNDVQVTKLQYNGAPVTLTLQQRAAAKQGDDPNDPDEWKSVENVTFYRNGEENPIKNSSYTPSGAGIYDFVAVINNGTTNGTQVASARLEVTKIPITVTPTWDGIGDATMNSVPDTLNGIELDVTGTMVGNDDDLLQDALAVSCSLYSEEGALIPDATGAFEVSLAWKLNDETGALTADAQTIQSRYTVTLVPQTLYHFGDSVTVSFSSGENGTIGATYVDASGTEFNISANGASISKDYDLKFTATPNAGYAIDQWTINGAVVNTGNGVTITSVGGGQTMRVDLSQFTTAGSSITVAVSFVNNSNALYFGVQSDGNGTITAVDTAGNELTSGASVSHGATVTFTAKPATGYMVEQWTVDNAVYCWPGTDEPYRSSTLTLENIDSSHNVYVQFENETSSKVRADVVNEKGAVSSAASISMKDMDGTVIEPQGGVYTVRGDTSFVLTANLLSSDNNTVREWQTSQNGTTWTTIVGSGGQTSLTVYNPTGDMYYRAVVVSAQQYNLSWQIEMNGEESVPEAANASLTATSNGVPLTRGQAQSAYIPVDFALTLDNAYYVVSWSDNVTSSGTTALLSSLSADTNVVVTIAKKPVVTIESVTGGTVTVEGTVNGEEKQEVANGGYVDYGTALTVTLQPDVGYEVGTIDGQTLNYTDGNGATTDDKAYTIESVQGDVTITPAWTQLNTYDVTYSVIDINGVADGGKNGSLTAAVDRKGIDGYKEDVQSSSDTVYAGSTLTFTARPAEGYRVYEWCVNNEVQQTNGVNNISTVLELDNIDEAVNVTVQFAEVGNRITVQAGENGTITSAMVGDVDQIGNISTGFTLAENAQLTLTAQPNAGYEVAAWTVNGEAISGETGTTFTYTAQHGEASGAVIGVTFQQVKYNVSWSAENGTITVDDYEDVSSAQIRGGTTLIFTATPATGFTDVTWTVNGTTVTDEDNQAAKLTWTVPNGMAATPSVEEYKIVAIFTKGSYNVEITQPENGSIRASIENLSAVSGGTEVTFTAKPDNGYILVDWKVNDVPVGSNSATYTLSIMKDTTVTAVIVPSHYDVSYSVSNSEHGSISANGYAGSSASVAYGDSITFTATPNDYYYVSGWEVDDVLQEDSANKTEFTLENVTAEHRVEAVFAQSVAYDVSYAAGTGGVLAVTDDGEPLVLNQGQTAPVWGGSKLVFTAAPETGKMVKSWKVNGEEVTRDNMETLGVTMEHYLDNVLCVESLNKNIDVQVEFEDYEGYPLPSSGVDYTVSEITRNPADTYQGAPTTQIRKGGDVTFVVTPAGHTITSLTVTDGTATLNANGSWTVSIENVQQEIELNATVVEGIPLVIGSPANGTITVTRDGTQLSSGAAVQVDDQLVITVTADSGYRLDTLTVNDAAFTSGSTYTVAQGTTAVAVAATFVQSGGSTTGGGGGGGGGGVAITDYEITMPTDVAHGEIEVTPARAEQGETVTITVTPDAGYVLDALTVSDEDDQTVALTDQGNGIYTFTMPASDVSIAVSFAPESAVEMPFTDVNPTDWFYDAVQYAYANGMMNGTSSELFTPQGTTTRGMIVTILHRLEGEPVVNYLMDFDDVDASSWYGEAVRWAASNGIVNGTSPTAFRPNDPITREQMATILYRYASFKDYDVTVNGTSLNAYADVSEISSYAVTAMQWANENGLITGRSETTLAPQGTATRAEVATILMRFCEEIAI